MNIWKILGIDKTTEKSLIKKAYREKLKKNRPDEDEAAFIKLRGAYEDALEYAENNYEEFEEDYEEEYEEHDDYEDFQDFEEDYYEDFVKQNEYNEWNIRLIELWDNLEQKYNPECWKKLLYGDAPYMLKFYEMARARIKELVFNKYSWVYLPVEVYKVIDVFFSFSTADECCIHVSNPDYQKWVNERCRISSKVDLCKLHKTVNPKTVDSLLYRYEMDIDKMISSNELGSLESLDIKYLPLETLKLSLKFDEYSDKEFDEAVETLKMDYGDDIEIELLIAERKIYKGEDATTLIKKLYEELPKTDATFTYRLMNCCKAIGMYYEGYMLAKHSLWLNLTKRMNEVAEEFSNLIENEYNGVTDTENIRMCRMYLRSNREKEAVEILSKVRESNSWEYHMARALAYFNEKNITPGIESYEFLKNFPKNDLHMLQLLEWEELQARYYFEKKEYKKCINKCNEILGRYPLSYPILILRGYADKAEYGEFGNYEIMVDLWRLYKRLEVTLFVAKEYCDEFEWKEMSYILEEVKDKCELQYRYSKIQQMEDEDYDKYKSAWMDLLKLMASKDFYIEVKSKYGLLDFEEILQDADSIRFVEDEKKEYKKAVTNIVNSTNNELGKQVDKSLYYYMIMDYQKALPEAINNLNNAESKEDRMKAMLELCESYALAGEYDKLDEQIRVFEENYPEYKDEFIGVYSRAIALYRYEDQYEKALSYALKCKEYLSQFTSGIYTDMIVSYYYLGRRDASNYQKAIDTANEFFSMFGKYWVVGPNDSPYRCLALSYAALGQVDKAMEALDFMYRYTINDYYRSMYYDYITEMYRVARQPDKALENLLKAEENGEYIARFTKEKLYMILGRYEEAYKSLFTIAENDTDPDADLVMCAMHSKYFMDGYVDMECVLNTKAEVERKLSMPGGQRGDNFFHMAQIYTILGNEEETKKYEELGLNYTEWDEPTSRVISIQLNTLWSYWYKGEYEKAYRYCKENTIIYFQFELVYLEYLLCEMFEKGKLDDIRNRFRNQ